MALGASCQPGGRAQTTGCSGVGGQLEVVKLELITTAVSSNKWLMVSYCWLAKDYGYGGNACDLFTILGTYELLHYALVWLICS